MDSTDLHVAIGCALAETGEAETAAEAFRRALALSPGHVEAEVNLGAALQNAGHLDAAEAALRDAARRAPDRADVRIKLAAVLRVGGRLDEAEAELSEVVRLAPDDAAALANLGGVRQQRGRFADAEDVLRKALSLAPEMVEAFNNLALVLQRTGRLEEAESTLREASRLKPDNVAALSNLGGVLVDLGRTEEAEPVIRRALDLDPDLVGSLNNLGLALKDLGRHAESEEALRRAILLGDDYADAHSNLGTTLEEMGRLEEAEAELETALALEPGHVEARVNLCVVLKAAGRPREAESMLREAVSMDPDNVQAHWNLALLMLLFDDFENGWREYDWRWRLPGRERMFTERPLWTGEDLSGRSLLVYAEQGFGDTLQFIRYLPEAAARAARVVVHCQPGLERLLRGSLVGLVAGVDTVISGDAPAPPTDFQAALLDLPALLGATREAIPDGCPYLHPRAAPQTAFIERTDGAVHVGLVWSGNPAQKDNRYRAVPLASLVDAVDVPGVRLHSLQVGAASDDIRSLGLVDRVADPTDRIADFLDTADAVSQLDLVITVDTAVVHLAGALAARVWVLLWRNADFRYFLETEDNPWYPTMRLFRQPARFEWDPVLERVRAELVRLVAEM